MVAVRQDDGQTVAKQATEQKAEAEHVGSSHWWWPFGKDEGGRDVAAKAAEQKAEIAAAKKVAAAAEPKAANPWWWPFGASSASKASGKPALVQQKVTKEWLDAHEKALREAIAGSEFTLERRDNALIVIAPADYSFNPKRHTMLMPITLNPLGKVAKMAQADPQSGILVLGHTDSTGSKAVNDKLSFERAQSVAAIFRLSGLKGDQLRLKGSVPTCRARTMPAPPAVPRTVASKCSIPSAPACCPWPRALSRTGAGRLAPLSRIKREAESAVKLWRISPGDAP